MTNIKNPIFLNSLEQEKTRMQMEAWCRDLVDTVDVFFRAECNEELLTKYVYLAGSTRTDAEFFEICRSMIAEKDVRLAQMTTDEDLDYCKDAFENMLSPTRRIDYASYKGSVSGMSMKLARAQRFICPHCLGRLDFTSQKIEVDHLWDRITVGNGRKNNLAAVHKTCNMNKGSRHILL